MTITRRQYTVWDINEWDSELVWDHADSDITREIKKDHTRVFRKAYIKRRLLATGLFESEWVEITEDVKRWGSVSSSIDHQRHGKLVFNGTDLVVQNIEGRYNPDDNTDSLWSGFANQQRSLVKIECGFYFQWLSTDDVWQNEIIPDDPTVFIGIISGNTTLSGENEVTLPIQPLAQVFQDFPANILTGFTTTGLSASQFIQTLRDQTDGAGQPIFRPFFNNTTSYWEITATSFVYTELLNTSSSADLQGMTVWDVIEKLSQSENFIAYITPTGKFRWVPKDVASTTSYQFFGLGITPNTEYGHTIKKVFSYGKKLTNFYSRVAVKFEDDNTITSFVNTGLAYAVNGTNTAWNLGHRTFSIDNQWIPNSAAAATIASAVFSELSALDEEINFSTTLIPHLNLLDRVNISYDATDFSSLEEYWDINDWDSELTWDKSRGDAIVLLNEPFKILSININLDNLETRFICRQLNE